MAKERDYFGVIVAVAGLAIAGLLTFTGVALSKLWDKTDVLTEKLHTSSQEFSKQLNEANAATREVNAQLKLEIQRVELEAKGKETKDAGQIPTQVVPR